MTERLLSQTSPTLVAHFKCIMPEPEQQRSAEATSLLPLLRLFQPDRSRQLAGDTPSPTPTLNISQLSKNPQSTWTYRLSCDLTPTTYFPVMTVRGPASERRKSHDFIKSDATSLFTSCSSKKHNALEVNLLRFQFPDSGPQSSEHQTSAYKSQKKKRKKKELSFICDPNAK